MEGSKCSCVVRGSINVDEFFHVRHIVRPGETLSSSRYENKIGGKGTNQTVAILRAGGTARFYGIVGRDGQWVRDRMREYGVDVSGIIVDENEATGRAIIQVEPDGENSIVLFAGANYSELQEQTFENNGEGWFPESTHLLLQNEIHSRSFEYAVKHRRNATLIMNPSPLPEISQIISFPWDQIDWLIINENEAHGLFTALASKSSASLSAREVVFLLSEQPKFTSTNIVCTLGSDGVLVFMPAFHRPKNEHEGPSFMHLPAAKLLGKIRDSTGAGDCFTGYFVQGLMEFGPLAKVGKDIKEHDIARILKVAVQAAGMCVEKQGTIESIPTKAQVEERMLSAV